MMLHHKAKKRGRERKVYIDEDLNQQIELMYYRKNGTKMAYGMFTALVNESLRDLMKKWQDNMTEADLKRLSDSKITSYESPTTKLQAVAKSVAGRIEKFTERFISWSYKSSTIDNQELKKLNELAAELIQAAAMCLAEVNLNPPLMLTKAEAPKQIEANQGSSELPTGM